MNLNLLGRKFVSRETKVHKKGLRDPVCRSVVNLVTFLSVGFQFLVNVKDTD